MAVTKDVPITVNVNINIWDWKYFNVSICILLVFYGSDTVECKLITNQSGILVSQADSVWENTVQYIPINMHTVFALLCFVVVIHWLIFPYPTGLLHWHCGNLTITPVPAKQPWWIWINTSCEFIMNDCITTTKQSTTKPFAYFLGYTVSADGRAPFWSGLLQLHYHLPYFVINEWPGKNIWLTMWNKTVFSLMVRHLLAPGHLQ